MKLINIAFFVIIFVVSSCSPKITVESNPVVEKKSTISNFDFKAPSCEQNEQEISQFDQSCLENDKQYVQAAFKGLSKKIDGAKNSISSLEKIATLDKNQYLKEINEQKIDIINDQNNNTLTDVKKNDYMLTLSAIGEDIAISTRNVKIELINAALVGEQLKQLIPFLKNELELISSTLGYKSIEELEALSESLISLNTDSTEDALEVELTYAQYKIAYDELDKLIEIIYK